MSTEERRIILVDSAVATREVVARRLRAQGFIVEEASDPATGADMALCAPPAAVVADLWMPSISGVQLCRLLRSEPATAEVAVILCGDGDDPRSRFWADRAGANAYVPKHRTGDLVRALALAVRSSEPNGSGFFFQLSGGTVDVRDRIARHLDAALFDSVIASEVRALASCGQFDRLFDLLAQFVSQVSRYRWLAVSSENATPFAIHHHLGEAASAEAEAREALGVVAGTTALRIEDEDALDGEIVAPAIVRPILFGSGVVGKVALSACSTADLDAATTLVSLIARELGGPIRMTSLIEESQRLASTDLLTGSKNRRAFMDAMNLEVARVQRHGYALSLAVLDLDHFKRINDVHGHGAGDRVLASLGALLRTEILRRTDIAARWGGEEFVVAFLSTNGDGATKAAERLRAAIADMVVLDDLGHRIPVTASIGIAELVPGESVESFIDRADRAMYVSKTSGRNRVTANVINGSSSEDRPAGESLPPSALRESTRAA